jgi:putative Holliday junction resolvase
MNEFFLPETHSLHMKTVLAVDYGEKFIGLASYCVNRDPYPTPYGRIQNKNNDFVLKELKRVISDELIDLMVIGLPHLLDGKKTSSTTRAESFIQLIREHLSLEVEEQDETLSTFEAESRMKNSPQYNFQVDLSKIDAVAASVILEDFIRRKKNDLKL